MSPLNRDRHRKKLQDLLSRANDEAFFEMVWAIDALQSGRADVASRYISFPREAVTADMGSSLKIHKWDMETLIGQLLATPKSRAHDGRNKVLNCNLFGAG